MQLLAAGKIDAFLAAPPDAQEFRANKIGHVVVNSMMDRPWSQYFCCLVAGNRDFVLKHPVATSFHLRRDSRGSIAYSEELISSTISVTLQSTDRHHGIVGQERCHN